MKMLTFDEVGDALDDIAEQFPKALFRGLNGGVNLLEDAVEDADFPGGEMYIMKNGWVQACFVGCDRIAANGDTANKIGTSGVAILAKHYGIPVYVLGPTSTVDPDCPDGEHIPIELRDPEEIKTMKGLPLAYNKDMQEDKEPVFDAIDTVEMCLPVFTAMVELVQGEGGVLPLDKDYVRSVAKLCEEKDWLLLVDEVQTGVGRTGSLFAFQQYGVLPDVCSFAKGIAGGLPMTIVAAGKGSTPEYALRYLLSENGVDPDKDVTIDWKSEHSECVAALASGEATVALLPQPFVTVAQNKLGDLRVALDLTEEWNKLDNGSSLITGVIVARKEVVDANPAAVKAFLRDYAASVGWVTGNVADAAQLIGSHDRLDGRTDIDTERVWLVDSAFGPELADAAREVLRADGRFGRILEGKTGCTIFSHCGPNTLGLAFFRKS